jgi:hypothetical protein
MQYEVITDGLHTFAPAPVSARPMKLKVYFMGLFHLRYRQNMRALLEGLKLVRQRHLDWDISVICRCDRLPVETFDDDVPVQVLPFAPEDQIALDLLDTDLLYQPLPFQKDAEALNKYSLSTKMVTYLGSGLPIFYHGPGSSAAAALLRQNSAASICTSLDPTQIAQTLEDLHANRTQIVEAALRLARERFSLSDPQARIGRYS